MSALADEPDAVLERDPLGADVALLAPEPLAAFNRAAVLSAADIQIAVALCALAGVADPPVLLASALAVRAPRLGHVLVDLETISQTVTVENEEPQIAALPWPRPADWVASVSPPPPHWWAAAKEIYPSHGRCDCSARGSTSTATGARSAPSRRR